jgi:hypothetical protein
MPLISKVGNEICVSTWSMRYITSSTSLIPMPDGTFWVSWLDREGSGKVKIKHFNLDGMPLASETLIAEGGGIQRSCACRLTSGNLISAWGGLKGEPGTPQTPVIYFQLLSSSGELKGARRILPGIQKEYQVFKPLGIFPSDAGHSLLVWSLYNAEDNRTTVFLNRIPEEGAINGSPQVCATSFIEESYSTSNASNGNLFNCLIKLEPAPVREFQVKGLIYSSNGDVLRQEFKVNDLGGDEVLSGNLLVAQADPDRMVALWNTTKDYELCRGRFLSNGGELLGPGFSFVSSEGSNSIFENSLALASVKGKTLLLVYVLYVYGTEPGYRLFAQLFSTNGQALGDRIIVDKLQSRDNFIRSPKIAALDGSRFVVLYCKNELLRARILQVN